MPGKTITALLKRIYLPAALLLFTSVVAAQYNWELEKSKDGINVYTADQKNSSFKAIKVEATLKGTYAKLIGILTNVGGFHKWIYHNKQSKILKKHTQHDLVYYSETSMPFPIANRDVIIRMQIKTDSLPKFMTVSGSNQNDYIPAIPGLQRIPFYRASWKISMPTANSLHIVYYLEVDPGGSLPAWLANSFADKGPFNTFSNLAEQLKE